MNNEKIKELANGYLKNIENDFGEELSYMESETIDEKDFIVLFYNSKTYIETGNFSDMIIGNAPIIISKKDGQIYETGTAHPIQYYIENFKKHGDPNIINESTNDIKERIIDKNVMNENEINNMFDEIAEMHNDDK